jgi:hypothetical protein
MPRRPKLTPEQVAELRGLAGQGATRTDLAARFGVSRTTVANLLRDGHPSKWSATAPGAARAAVKTFIGELGELRGERRAVASLALVLADRVDGSPGVAGAAAAVAQLATLVEQLKAGQTDEDAHVCTARACGGRAVIGLVARMDVASAVLVTFARLAGGCSPVSRHGFDAGRGRWPRLAGRSSPPPTIWTPARRLTAWRGCSCPMRCGVPPRRPSVTSCSSDSKPWTSRRGRRST